MISCKIFLQEVEHLCLLFTDDFREIRSWLTGLNSLNLSYPNPGGREKTNLNFYFYTSLLFLILIQLFEMQEMGRVTNRREKLNVDPLKGNKKIKPSSTYLMKNWVFGIDIKFWIHNMLSSKMPVNINTRHTRWCDTLWFAQTIFY